MEFLEGLEITVGPVVLVVAPLVAAIIQVLKHVQWNGNPLLPNETAIWVANALLGGVAFTLYQLSQGESIGAALLNAIIAVFGASGVFEGVKSTVGKLSSTQQPEKSGDDLIPLE